MDPLLLTPGPLTTAPEVRAAMTRDLGSRDPAFVNLVRRVRHRLCALVPKPDAFTAVPMQGSGTFAVEGMLTTFVPPEGTAVVFVNGVYGARAAEILERAGRTVVVIETPEEDATDVGRLDEVLQNDPGITYVFTVHSETTTGQLLPVEAISRITEKHGRRLLVDTMSSFGAVSLDGVVADAFAASGNKCLEGTPGLAFVVARKSALAECRGQCSSVSLDLFAQEERLAKDGQFRFTPPTHILLALDEALSRHAAEGGTEGRGARYRANLAHLVGGMQTLGFRPLLPADRQGPIIVTFHAPSHPAWHFGTFYDALRARGFAIYPGSLTQRPTFRVGCIGQVFPSDIDRFVAAVGEVATAMNLPLEAR